MDAVSLILLHLGWLQQDAAHQPRGSSNSAVSLPLFHLNVSFKISFQEEFRTFGCFLKFWPETEGYVLNGQFQNLPQAEIFGNRLK